VERWGGGEGEVCVDDGDEQRKRRKKKNLEQINSRLGKLIHSYGKLNL